MPSSYRPNQLQPNIGAVRIILIHKKFKDESNPSGGYHSHKGLGVTASYTAKTLQKHGIWANYWEVTSGKEIRERLRRVLDQSARNNDIRPTHVVLSAPWIAATSVNPNEVTVARLAAEFPDQSWIVESHSNVGFLAADAQAIKILRGVADLQMATHNVFVAGNSKKFTDWATLAWNVKVVLLPNLYNTTEAMVRPRVWNGGSLRIGLFGANRPLKNWTTAAAAVVELVTRMEVPTQLCFSTQRNEGGNVRSFFEMTTGYPNLQVAPVPWEDWPVFLRTVRSMNLLVQPSYTESFNVVSADAVSQGIPIAVSPAIDWLPDHWQAEPDNPRELARVMEMLLRDPNASGDGRRALDEYVRWGVWQWRKFLCQEIHEIQNWRRYSDDE